MSDGDVLLIPTDPDTPYPLGRSIVNHDPRNRLHRALDLPRRITERRNAAWWSMDVYDQISDDCTANACIGVLRTQPNYPLLRKSFTQFDSAEDRVALYKRAQLVDPWPGEDYGGTSTDAPWKVLRNDGLIPGWKWLFGLDELKEFLRYYGPVAVGTNWYESMFYPNKKNYVTIDDARGVAGGHAYRVVFFNPNRGFRIVNSWGRDWGVQGRAWISVEDMTRLLEEQGEIVTVG